MSTAEQDAFARRGGRPARRARLREPGYESRPARTEPASYADGRACPAGPAHQLLAEQQGRDRAVRARPVPRAPGPRLRTGRVLAAAGGGRRRDPRGGDRGDRRPRHHHRGARRTALPPPLRVDRGAEPVPRPSGAVREARRRGLAGGGAGAPAAAALRRGRPALSRPAPRGRAADRAHDDHRQRRGHGPVPASRPAPAAAAAGGRVQQLRQRGELPPGGPRGLRADGHRAGRRRCAASATPRPGPRSCCPATTSCSARRARPSRRWRWAVPWSSPTRTAWPAWRRTPTCRSGGPGTSAGRC